MSVKHDIAKLVETVRMLERLVLKGSLPEVPAIYERDDGTEDVERFQRDYGCTPDQAAERGAATFVRITNFKNPNVEMVALSCAQSDAEPP